MTPLAARPFVAADRRRYRAEAVAVAVRIAARQEEMGISAVELGLRAGIPTRRVLRLATGTCLRGPTTGEVLRLASAIGVEPAWLAWGVTPAERVTA